MNTYATYLLSSSSGGVIVLCLFFAWGCFQQKTSTEVTHLISRSQSADQSQAATRDDAHFDQFRITYAGITDTKNLKSESTFNSFQSRLYWLQKARKNFSNDSLHHSSFLRRNAGIALQIAPIEKGHKFIAELGADATIQMVDGTQVKPDRDVARGVRYPDLERRFPNAHFLHFHDPKLEAAGTLSTPQVIRGELLLTPGTAYKLEFEGADEQSKMVDGQTFTLHSLTSEKERITAKIQFPMPAIVGALSEKELPTQMLKSLLDNDYCAMIEDNQGEYHFQTSVTDRLASGKATFAMPYDRKLPLDIDQRGPNPVITFGFNLLPPERTIKKIHVTFKDRTGPTEFYPFKIEVK